MLFIEKQTTVKVEELGASLGRDAGGVSGGLMEKCPWLPGCTYFQLHTQPLLHPWLGD